MVRLTQTVYIEGKAPQVSSRDYYMQVNALLKRLGTEAPWPTAAIAELKREGFVQITAPNGYIEIELKEVTPNEDQKPKAR